MDVSVKLLRYWINLSNFDMIWFNEIDELMSGQSGLM